MSVVLPRAATVIAGLDDAGRAQAAQFLAIRAKGLARGHPAGPVVAALTEAVTRDGGLRVDAATLGQAERYQVSIWLHDAWDQAANSPDGRKPAAAGVLGAAAVDWDRELGVSGAPSWRGYVAAGEPRDTTPKDLGA